MSTPVVLSILLLLTTASNSGRAGVGAASVLHSSARYIFRVCIAMSGRNGLNHGQRFPLAASDSGTRQPDGMINTAKGQYDWSQVDRWFAELQQHDVEDVLYTFGKVPPFASSRPKADCNYGPGQCAPPSDLGC